MYMGFSQLAKNERRRTPILGRAYYDFSLGFYQTQGEMEKAREEYINNWEKETERMIIKNPNLIIVD
jgi:hypothetical protein